MRFFVDFDNTITVEDANAALFNRFGTCDNSRIVQLYIKKEISSVEASSYNWMNIKASRQEMENFLVEIDIDAYFFEFYSFCKRLGAPLTILSDGVDFYIQHILRRYHLEHIPVISNRLLFTDDNNFYPEFPFYEQGCKWCGNCKGIHMDKKKNEGDTIVYIGDGYSDVCAIPKADILFAKGDLLNYCIENKIFCYHFGNFKDVLTVIEKEILQFSI